jgi:hypothetical protein
MKALPLVLSLAGLLAACSDGNDAAEDRMERQAEASAAVSGPAIVALGLTEAQLLDAELIGAAGADIGDVAQVLKAANGSVDQLLVEIEDSHPDRFVRVPLSGLTPLVRGNDTDLSTTMTKADLEALPAVSLPTG